MTWIKPSFLWLMARSNWGTKSNQEYILGIKIKRSSWEKALSLGILTHPDQSVYSEKEDWEVLIKNAPVHIQWDPERSIHGKKLNERAIQVGISRFLVNEFNEDWIVEISDFTPLTKKINQLRRQGKYKEAKRLLPREKVYYLPKEVKKRIGIK